MQFTELIQLRRSIRGFSAEPVEPWKLQKILEAVNEAPSAGNRQAYEVFVVRRPEDRAALAVAPHGQDFLRVSPVVLVFCTHPRSPRPTMESAARACTRSRTLPSPAYAMLAIVDLGLSTVWVGAFEDDEVWRAIGSPEGLHPVAMLPVGYAAMDPRPKSRRELSGLIHEL
jgi:nitroreductase